MRALLPASVALLFGVGLVWCTSAGDGAGSAPASTPTTCTDPAPATQAQSLVLRGAAPPSRARGRPTFALTTAAALHLLLGLEGRTNTAWNVQLALIEGTADLASPALLRAISDDDDLYLTWVGLSLAFDGPAVAPHDLATLDRLAAALGHYAAHPDADAALLGPLREFEERLCTVGAVHLPLELAEQLLPRWNEYLASRSSEPTLRPPEAVVFRDLMTLVHDMRESRESRFPPLLDLLARAEARLAAEPTDAGPPPPRANAHAGPWSRWRADLGRLLLVPSAPLDDALLERAVVSSPALAVVAALPPGDLARVLLREAGLATLTAGEGIARDEINRLARSHVERFLAFLALLEVETAYGCRRLFPYGPDGAAARLYLLTSALHARGRLSRVPDPEPTWLTPLRDDGFEPYLAAHYPDLSQAREAAWEALAVELQGVVAAVLVAQPIAVR